MRSLAPLCLALLTLPLLACAMLKEVSVGYADAIAGAELPTEGGSYQDLHIAFPALTNIDPLSSPSLSRHEVSAEEIESVKITGVELEGPSGACGLPFSGLELVIENQELGPETLATAQIDGEGCVAWTLAEAELGPWFRKGSISIVAVADGEPLPPSASLSLNVSFLIDVRDKPIESD